MRTVKIISIVAMIISFFIFSKARAQEDKTLFEKVTVVNIQLPVRVFLKGRPVGGLTKKDFKIFVDGKERAINGCFEVRKKLSSPDSPSDTKGKDPHASPRLFIFIFNVSDYHLDLKKDIDIIFRKILRFNDRFMVISNNFFLPETIFKDPELEKKKMLTILQKESQKLKMDILQVEVELRSLADNFLSRMSDRVEQQNPDYPYVIFREFVTHYIFTLEQFKQGYFGMAKEQYIRIAEYLKSQDAEKWVLNFFQIGLFPKIKVQGAIRSLMNAYKDSFTSSSEGPRPRIGARLTQLLTNFWLRQEDVDKWMVDNISKLFVNSGATVHTLLIKPISKTFMNHYDYKPISTDSESILRNIARLTGGIVDHSRNTDKFVDKISDREDIYYILTYVPEKNEPKNSYIKIVVNSDKNYRLSYDNQRRPRFFRHILDRIKKENPQIRIQKILLNNNLLSVVVSNIKTVLLGKADESRLGKIEAKVRILDHDSKTIWKIKKVYKSKKSRSAFQTQIPSLEKGTYDVIVEVKDLLSWKTDTAGENIRIFPENGRK